MPDCEKYTAMYESFKNATITELEAMISSTEERDQKVFFRALINLKLQLGQEKVVGELLL